MVTSMTSKKTKPDPAAFAAAVPDAALQPPHLPMLDDPDFVDRVWQYMLTQWPLQLQGIPPDQVEDVKQRIREAERGERPYITPAGVAQRQRRAEQILALFNGRNAAEVARELNIGRATVYRTLKQSGRRFSMP